MILQPVHYIFSMEMIFLSDHIPDNSDRNQNTETRTFSIPEPREIVQLDTDTVRNLHKLAMMMERMRFVEYLDMVTRPGRIWYTNFLWGLARGLGFGLGMTVLLGLTMYLLAHMVNLPLIGGLIADIYQIVQEQVGTSPNFKP